MLNIYLPLKKRCVFEIKMENEWNKSPNIGVFLNISSDGAVVKLFLDAINENNLEDAKNYISKNFVDKIDLLAVKEFFAKGKVCKHIMSNDFSKMSKVVKTNSLLITGNGISEVLHLHMIQEPDKNGNWKIYGIEKE